MSEMWSKISHLWMSHGTQYFPTSFSSDLFKEFLLRLGKRKIPSVSIKKYHRAEVPLDKVTGSFVA
jgi:hypothetical protein